MNKKNIVLMYPKVMNIVFEKSGIKLFPSPKDYFKTESFTCKENFLLFDLIDGEVFFDRDVIKYCFGIGSDLPSIIPVTDFSIPFTKKEVRDFLDILFSERPLYFPVQKICNYLRICSFMLADESFYEIEDLIEFNIQDLCKELTRVFGFDSHHLPFPQKFISYLFFDQKQ